MIRIMKWLGGALWFCEGNFHLSSGSPPGVGLLCVCVWGGGGGYRLSWAETALPAQCKAMI